MKYHAQPTARTRVRLPQPVASVPWEDTRTRLTMRTRTQLLGLSGDVSAAGGVLKENKKNLHNENINERSRGRSLLPGHGTFSTSKVGGWRRLAVGGWRRLAVGGWWLVRVSGWRLVVVGSGWWSLGRSLRAILNEKKIRLLKTPLFYCSRSHCQAIYAQLVHRSS